ncbi:hypothetical protein J6590_091098 [Homalodisca vitripennis]|nr:hypothetical protein J6590_091098 [Homalodisca vitripennis]
MDLAVLRIFREQIYSSSKFSAHSSRDESAKEVKITLSRKVWNNIKPEHATYKDGTDENPIVALGKAMQACRFVNIRTITVRINRCHWRRSEALERDSGSKFRPHMFVQFCGQGQRVIENISSVQASFREARPRNNVPLSNVLPPV